MDTRENSAVFADCKDLRSGTMCPTYGGGVLDYVKRAPASAVRTARLGERVPKTQKGLSMVAFLRFILGHRWLTGGVILISMFLAIYSARTIESRFQFRDLYDYPANPHVELFKQDNKEFGDPAGYVVALIQSKDVFEPQVVAYVQRLTDALEPNDIFIRVRSLTNARAVRAAGDEVVSGPLLAEIPKDKSALDAIKNFALNSGLLSRRLVSKDATTTAVLAEMRTPASFATVAEQHAALETVQKAIAANPPPAGVTVRITGAPAVEVAGTEALDEDQGRLMPFVLLLLIAILFFTFRSWHGIVLCLASVIVATIWTFGIFSLFGRPLDMISSIIPTTMLVYAVVDPIFVLARVLTKADQGRSRTEAIYEAFSELALPCFLTSLTTSLGFAAFVAARSPMIRYYGITVAIGVLLAWVTTITVLPLLLSIVPLPKRRFAAIPTTRLVESGISRGWTLLRNHARPVALAAVAFVVAGGLYARSLYVDNTYIGDLPRGPILDDVRELERKLSGVVRLIVHLEGPEDSLKRPEVLKAIEAVDKAAEKEPLVTSSSSIADLVAEANQAFNNGDPAEHRVPDSRSLNAQYLSLLDPNDRADFATADYKRTHIAILLEDHGSAETQRIAERVQRAVDAAGLKSLGIRASLTGNAVVAYREVDELCRELLWGFITAFSIIVVLEILLFQSLRLALISVLPNLVPVVACFTTLRLINYPLRIDSVLVLCISIGGLFNTTIHIAARIRQLVKGGEHDAESVIGRSLVAVGPSSLFTALTLSAGFSVLLLSKFPALQMLGLLSTITLMSGFFADMIVTPALMRFGFDWGRAARESMRPVAPAEPALSTTFE